MVKQLLQAFEKHILRAQVSAELDDFRPGMKIYTTIPLRAGSKIMYKKVSGVCIKRTPKTVLLRQITSAGRSVELFLSTAAPFTIKSEPGQHKPHVRRACLYYLRGKYGKAARIRVKK